MKRFLLIGYFGMAFFLFDPPGAIAAQAGWVRPGPGATRLAMIDLYNALTPDWRQATLVFLQSPELELNPFFDSLDQLAFRKVAVLQAPTGTEAAQPVAIPLELEKFLRMADTPKTEAELRETCFKLAGITQVLWGHIPADRRGDLESQHLRLSEAKAGAEEKLSESRRQRLLAAVHEAERILWSK